MSFINNKSPYFFSEIQMSDITDISEENMKILTGLPAKSARVKKYLCITDASYIYGNLHFFSLITHTHPARNTQVHENAITAFALYISRNPNLKFENS